MAPFVGMAYYSNLSIVGDDEMGVFVVGNGTDEFPGSANQHVLLQRINVYGDRLFDAGGIDVAGEGFCLNPNAAVGSNTQVSVFIPILSNFLLFLNSTRFLS